MQYSDEHFIIEYNPCDEEYIGEVIDTLNCSLDGYMEFFNLTSLDEKIKIKFYDQLDNFKIFCESITFKPYRTGHVGHAKGNEIHMLSYQERIKQRPNDTKERFLMGLKHELVHICHIAYKRDKSNKSSWFAEGLANCLGSPMYESTLDGCTVEDLLHKPKYKYCYTITKYMLENYSHEEILRYAANHDLVIKDTEKIFNEAKSYYSKKSK